MDINCKAQSEEWVKALSSTNNLQLLSNDNNAMNKGVVRMHQLYLYSHDTLPIRPLAELKHKSTLIQSINRNKALWNYHITCLHFCPTICSSMKLKHLSFALLLRELQYEWKASSWFWYAFPQNKKTNISSSATWSAPLEFVCNAFVCTAFTQCRHTQCQHEHCVSNIKS